MNTETQPVRIFIAYSHKDLEFQIELKTHLEPLVRNGRIVVMDNYAVKPGEEWSERIGQMMEQSDIVLLLLSADSLSSPHFYTEAKIAIEQRRKGRTEVIPVKLRTVDLEDEPLLQELNTIEVLPLKDKPVIKWEHRDDAYQSIVKGLKVVLNAQNIRAERRKQYAGLAAEAFILIKKKRWAEARIILDTALPLWETNFEPSRELLQKYYEKITEECRYCHGSGKISFESPRGTYDIGGRREYYYRECPNCKGSGRVVKTL